MGDVPYPPTPLTAAQRKKVRKFYEQNPRGGYRLALQAAGRHETRAVAQAIIMADDELADLPIVLLHVDRGDALAAVGEILNDPDHKDRLRAALAALAMLHGLSEKQALELSGPDGGPMEVTSPDVADAVDRFTTLAAAAVRRTAGNGTDEADPEPEPGGES